MVARVRTGDPVSRVSVGCERRAPLWSRASGTAAHAPHVLNLRTRTGRAGGVRDAALPAAAPSRGQAHPDQPWEQCPRSTTTAATARENSVQGAPRHVEHRRQPGVKGVRVAVTGGRAAPGGRRHARPGRRGGAMRRSRARRRGRRSPPGPVRRAGQRWITPEGEARAALEHHGGEGLPGRCSPRITPSSTSDGHVVPVFVVDVALLAPAYEPVEHRAGRARVDLRRAGGYVAEDWSARRGADPRGTAGGIAHRGSPPRGGPCCCVGVVIRHRWADRTRGTGHTPRPLASVTSAFVARGPEAPVCLGIA